MEKHTVIAVDIAKVVLELAVSHEEGRIALKRRLSRDAFLPFFAQTPPATVVMEACGSAHFWARKLQELGHQVVLLPPHQVRPYVTRNKTDRTDAKGILEAYRNADIRPVPVKSLPQQVLVSLHRFRSSWLANRTAQINTLRGLLREMGVLIPMGAEKVLPQVRALVEDADSGIPEVLRPVLFEACEEIQALTERIKMTERQIEAIAEQTPVVERLRSIPGIGLLTATALVAFVGDVQRFPSGRHFASYLGLTPREYSSGLKRRLGRISKRGDAYLRMLLIHGARSVLCHAKKAKEHDRLRTWALALEKRMRHNKAAVALANKLARIAWAVWKHDRPSPPCPRRPRRRPRKEGFKDFAHPGTARVDHVMAKQVGPAGGKSRTSVARRGRFHRLAPACAYSIMGRSPKSSTEEAADTFAVPTSQLSRLSNAVPAHGVLKRSATTGGPMS